jgi:phosphoglycerol transferase MdoB-like AlkP superfamily enzyme
VVRERSEWLKLAATLPAGTFLWAVLCNVVLDASTGPFHLLGHLGSSLVSIALLWFAIVGLVCVTNRLWLSFGLSLGLCLVVAAASLAKFRVRDEPLYPADLDFLWQPSFLLDMASPVVLVVVALGACALVAGLVLVGRRLDARFPRVRRSTDPRTWSRVLGLRIAVTLVAVLVLVQTLNFNGEGNRLRSTYEAFGADFLTWRQADNYAENGFAAGFLFNTYTTAMEKPAGYNRAAMDQIAERYRLRADSRNTASTKDALKDVNVVLLLSEAFSDPERLAGVDLAEDPMPFIRKTMLDHPSGSVVVSAIGGGTANVEFEALTGMSQTLFAPQLTTPYQMLVPAHDSMPSVAQYFAAMGDRTMAVHPYLGSMYRRSASYPRLGFDSFLDIGKLAGLTRIGRNPSVSDASTFDDALRLLRSSDQPVFMNLVTMQNHFPYDDLYDDPIANSLHSDALGQYARGIAHSDQATEKLLGELRRMPEETLVIFYGDHLPGAVYDDDVIQANLDKNTETPFFIWSSHRQLKATRLPDTSPNYFMPLAFEAIGAPVPPYYALLLDLHDEIPALSGSRPVDPTKLSTRARALIRDLRLVQYDFSVGRRYATEKMFSPAP